MNKAQRLRNAADGLMAGLVANGFQGPWRWSNHEWEFAFYQAWGDWPPQTRNPSDFPTFKLGGYGSSSEPRELLWQLKRTSPFSTYASEPLNTRPFGLTPAEFLEIWAKGASPEEWVDLAAAFLQNMERPT